MVSVPPIFWVETGLVLASPLSERPPLLELELLLLGLLAELLELLPDPHAVTAIAQAIATARVSVSRKRRIF
jgi:hypothetical protein